MCNMLKREYKQLCLLIVLLLMCVALVLTSCTYRTSNRPENKIVITKTIVNNSIFGYIGPNSVVFDYNSSEKGYMIQVVNKNVVIKTLYCIPEQLDFNVEKIKYEYYQEDSVIFLPSKIK